MVFYPTEPAPSSSLDSLTIRENFNFLDNTLINHVSASSAHNLDAIDIDVIGSPVVDNVEELHNHVFSAGTFCEDYITDDGDGTITVSSGSGLIRTWDNIYAPLVSFEWASSSSIAIGDDALTYVYIDYNGGSPVIKTTTNRNDISDNCEVCIGHVYKEAGILTIHVRTGGLNTCDITRKVDRRIKDLRNFERSSGMVTSETGIRNIGITAGEAWRGLDLFTTSAQNTSGSGDVFTYYYRDGGGGWTEISGSTQIDNTQYDDGDGGLATLGVGRYGVHWIFLCNDSHIDIVYGQGNYKLAEAQNAEVPAVPVKIDKFDILIARIIILRDAATFTEVATAFEIFFPRSEVINHNDLGNIDGGAADEYYHLTDAEHGALVDGGSADGYHTHPDSGSLDTLDSVCERGATTDVAITVDASGSIFTSLLVVEDLQIGEDLEVDGNTVVDGTTIVNTSGSMITSLLIPGDLQVGNYLIVGNNADPNAAVGFPNRFCASNQVTSPNTSTLAGQVWNMIIGTPTNLSQLGAAVEAHGSSLTGSISVSFVGLEGTASAHNSVGVVTMTGRCAGVVGNLKVTGDTHNLSDGAGIWGQAPTLAGAPSSSITNACAGYFDKVTVGVNNYSVYGAGLIYSAEDIEAGGKIIANASGSVFNSLKVENKLHVHDDVLADSQIWINADDSNEIPTLTFRNYNAGSPESFDMKVRDDYDCFYFDHRIVIDNATQEHAIILGWFNKLSYSAGNSRFEFNQAIYTSGDMTIQGIMGVVGDISSNANMNLNVGNSADDAIITFNKSGSGDETLKWDNTDDRFEFSDDLFVDGEIEFDSGSINHKDLSGLQGGQANEYYHLEDAEHGALVDGGSADGYHTHPASGSASAGTDTLDDVCDRGNTTDQDITAADIKADGDITINEDETDVDAILHFKTSGSVDETLRWNKTTTRFEFSDDLYIGGDLYFPYNKKINIPTFQLIPILWEIWGTGTEFYIGEDNDKFITISTPTGHVSFFEDVTIAQDLYIGNESSASNKVIYANNGDGSLPNLRYNESTNKWQFSNDGTTWSDIGSSGVKTIEFDVGGMALGDGTAGSAAPALSLVTTSDGTTPKCRTFCLRFDDTTNEHCFWQDRMPLDYSSGGRMKVQFYNVDVQISNAKTVQFDVALQAVTPGDATIMTALDLSNDGGGWVGALKTLNVSSASAARLYELSIDMTSYLDGLAAGDFMQFGFRRNCASGSATGDMAVTAVAFEYNY